MIVFRLCKAKYCRDLSGKGAEKNGGRWNSKGIAVVYTSESRALAVTELAVHTPLSIVPLGIKIVTIEIPDTIPIYQIKSLKLSKGWKQASHHPSTKKIGDLWLKNNEHLLMKVPSAVIKGDHNFLINPSHAEFHLIKILKTEEFFFDSRLFIQNENLGNIQ